MWRHSHGFFSGKNSIPLYCLSFTDAKITSFYSRVVRIFRREFIFSFLCFLAHPKLTLLHSSVENQQFQLNWAILAWIQFLLHVYPSQTQVSKTNMFLPSIVNLLSLLTVDFFAQHFPLQLIVNFAVSSSILFP